MGVRQASTTRNIVDLETAKKWAKSPAVVKYLGQIDDDVANAQSNCKSILGEMGSDYPTKYTKEFKDDASDLADAWKDFTAEYNAITVGKAPDGKRAMVAFKKLILQLGVLEEQNIRFGAYVDADFANFSARFVAMMIAVQKRAKNLLDSLIDDLVWTEGKLREAKNDVTGAEIQRALNIALTAVSLALPELRLGAAVGVAALTLTAQLLIDAGLGPGKPAAVGVANSAAGDIVGLPKLMRTPMAKVLGGLSGVASAKMDTDEIEEAKRIVEDVKKRIKTIEGDIKLLLAFCNNDVPKLEKMQDAFEGAMKDAAAAASKYTSAESRRQGLLNELKKL